MATGVNASKANLGTVLAPPTGVDASKANLGAVLAPPIGENISKAYIGAVITSQPYPAINMFCSP